MMGFGGTQSPWGCDSDFLCNYFASGSNIHLCTVAAVFSTRYMGEGDKASEDLSEAWLLIAV